MHYQLVTDGASGMPADCSDLAIKKKLHMLINLHHLLFLDCAPKTFA